jgi:hypothetical protein
MDVEELFPATGSWAAHDGRDVFLFKNVRIEWEGLKITSCRN